MKSADLYRVKNMSQDDDDVLASFRGQPVDTSTSRGYSNWQQGQAYRDLANLAQGSTSPNDSNPSSGGASSGSGGGCFIATAVYGDSSHPCVQELRNFRSEYLLPYSLGRRFAHWYEENGPGLGVFVRQRRALRTAIRAILTPVAVALRAVRFGKQRIGALLPKARDQ